MNNTQIAPYLNLSYPATHGSSDPETYILSIMVPLPEGVAIAEVSSHPSKTKKGLLIIQIDLEESKTAGVSVRTLDVTLSHGLSSAPMGMYDFAIAKDITTVQVQLVSKDLQGYNLRSNSIKLSSATPSFAPFKIAGQTFFLVKPHVLVTKHSSPGEHTSYTMQTFLPLFQGQEFHEIIGPFHDLNNSTTYFTMMFRKSAQSIGQIIGKTVTWTLDPAFAHLLKNISVSAVQEDPEVSGSTSTEYEEAEEGGNG